MHLELAPNHLVDNANVALNNLHNLGRNYFVSIVRYWQSVIAIVVHIHCTFDCLEEGLLVDAGDEETTLVKGLRTLGRGADAHCREGMTNASEERRFFGECTRVRDDGIGIHLEAVVVVESERLVLDDTWIELEA